MASQEGCDLWQEAVSGPSLLLVSPEQLKSKPFEHILHNNAFTSHLCLLVVDEMHRVLDWGTGSRIAFKHISTTLAHMPETTCLLGVTATLPAIDAHTLAEALGLTWGSFHFLRRSNLRTDVCMEF